jgi:acetyl-CoA acyltransferase
MGLTAERVATHYGISREESDAFALASHQKALKAIAEGKFEDEIVPVNVTTSSMNGGGKPSQSSREFKVDEGPRADTSAEALSKLRPAFSAKGVVTAGNSSQTSDGHSAAGKIRIVRVRWLSSRGNGDRPSLRNPQGIEACRA